MKFAVSNIALPAFDHLSAFPVLRGYGFTGLEVAPSRVWHGSWDAAGVAAYRRAAESAGLAVVGLHSLFFDRPELGLFKPAETRLATLDFMTGLSALCRDLGGRTLIYGGGRRRGEMPVAQAMDETRRFLSELLPRMEAHGTMLCFEPLGPKDSDFLNSAAECRALADEFAHPALGLQLDAKALVENGETGEETFRAVKGRLAHFHANDPGLVVPGSTGIVDHAVLGARLRAIGYDGWVSSEQRMLSEAGALADAEAGGRTLLRCYGS
ncbi:putative D-tagatose 3-epimerase [Paramagnetospirillum magnetotacticum MS-1]|uniref:Putative D-tagatose 3-epimerase n=1 Tax=Paramagnetospirillum magnetotacticum MS-1 TaxID=272627 RepID=A0A0C2YDF3_PARME|nr:sugar phosphate isomerase/epimerase family protein [Paramagnetospirillum magnetotacticum]KIL97739.1 putative D-tagatose 3-epimerase [Paramagnetospirillum magnetotacticum MS-1]